MKVNEAEWYELWMDTPMQCPGGSRAQALVTPGNCVKSYERGPGNWPKHHGRIARYEKEEVVVIGHNSMVSPPFVWRGSPTQYQRTWDID